MNSPYFPTSSFLAGSPAAPLTHDLPNWVVRLFNHLGCGFVLLDSNASLVIANDAARELLEPLGCRIGASRGGQFDASALPDITRCIEAAKAGEQSMALIEVAPRGRFVLAASPVLLSEIETGLVLTTEKSLPCDLVSLRAYAALMGLTPAETRVLVQLVRGDSPHEAAQTLGVGIATVRSHVKAILTKTDCDSIRDLMVHASRLPTVLGAEQ
jgi:DNA-binding CsgD family transcriptional regulator